MKCLTFFTETLTHLSLGESELELYLLQNPPTSTNFKEAKKELANAKHHLQVASKAGSKVRFLKPLVKSWAQFYRAT